MDSDNKRIPVTKPFLPPREEYEALIDEIWKKNWLTNNGPFVQRLEEELEEYLGVSHLNYVSNGTIALQIAIKVLKLRGEIITTPFSYVATTSSIVWEGCTPVFVDIDPDTLNINPSFIEESITDQTTAILATHVFGNPCDIEAIQKIADRHGLKVIYDAAHCFGTKYKGKSVYNYGDISTASFHATKLFHTVEGGALVTQNADLSKRFSYIRNFGHDGFGAFNGVGINGKNSEFHAAMGLCNLRYMDEILTTREKQYRIYNELLNSRLIRKQKIEPGTTTYNCAYYPIVLQDEAVASAVKESLENSNIFPRRYFYPSLNKLEYVRKQNAPISSDIAKRILCLPVYHQFSDEQQNKVSKIVLKIL